MQVLLHSPMYRPNLSNMIRSAEFFGLDKIYIYDSNDLLNPPNNKASRAEMNHMARVWTAGAIEHIDVIKVEDDLSFITKYPGRTIATILDEKAEKLSEFTFENEDLIILGNEKTGIPPELAENCTHSLILPSSGVTDCLNVAVSLGIFLYAHQTDTSKVK